ncbi:hypothetical protein BGZ54_009914 [Gamsiella multidivaricata]|nr:hypothetical protein BGZ54_009914 [Gamsiella multidivaricata]
MSSFEEKPAQDAFSRGISKVVTARGTAEGVGTMVQRSIGGPDLESLDPFLTLDEFRMSPPSPSKADEQDTRKNGFPDHPHRGFETVTLMLKGHFQHEDFAGHKGRIGPGDVQWMTAGRGIVHAEMPLFLGEDEEEDGDKDDIDRNEESAKPRALADKAHAAVLGAAGAGDKRRTKNKKTKKAQDIWGLQLWINLPKEHKLCKPQYQEFKDERIPRWSNRKDVRSGNRDSNDSNKLSADLDLLTLNSLSDSPPERTIASERPENMSMRCSQQENDIEVKVIAGESHGVRSKVYTRTPTQYLEINMKRNQVLREWIPETHEGFVYVLQGRGRFGENGPVEGLPQQLLILESTSASSGSPNSVRRSRKVGDIPMKATTAAPTTITHDGVSQTGLQKSFLQIETKDEPLHMVLVTGEPCREPVFRQGPFVMASKDELERTFRDYEEKKRGFERAQGWKSSIGGGLAGRDELDERKGRQRQQQRGKRGGGKEGPEEGSEGRGGNGGGDGDGDGDGGHGRGRRPGASKKQSARNVRSKRE